jgi:hypothetical protein
LDGVTKAAEPFTIRALANGGTTLEYLRKAVLEAPPEANLILLRLQDGTLRFPPVCPNCGQPAASALRIQRAFLFHVQSGDDTPNETVPSIDAFEVPFCDACLHRQRSEQSAPGFWTPLLRILSGAEGLAGLVVMAIAFMFLASALKRLSVFPLVLASLPLMVGFWLLRSTWNKSRHMSLPKPATVDLAVDFTPSLAFPFEPVWRAFQFRSQPYADLFRQANQPHLWSQHSLEAQSAAAQRQRDSSRTNLIVGTIVVAFLLWSLWREGLSQYVMPYLKP